jgi:quercetin dioxygenase-like cupin family protein
MAIRTSTPFHPSVSPRVLDVLGPRVELLTDPLDADALFCVIRGMIPPGVAVPLHGHADVESFYVLSGKAQALIEEDGRREWRDVREGDFFHIPGSVLHAHRNPFQEPVVELIVTTPRLGRFFQEVGRPVASGAALTPPTVEEVERFTRAAARYGHRMPSAEENAAVGIEMP